MTVVLAVSILNGVSELMLVAVVIELRVTGYCDYKRLCLYDNFNVLLNGVVTCIGRSEYCRMYVLTYVSYRIGGGFPRPFSVRMTFEAY